MSISQEIDAKINIVELVGRYIPMKKAWANYKALCPFHGEKTPSFIISPAKNIAYCFSCHHGWGPIKFLSEVEKIDFKEAVHILAKEAGVELKTNYYKEHSDWGGDVYAIYKLVSSWYQDELKKEENADKLAYVKRRWISDETIKTFGIGYSGDSRWLFAHLKANGFTPKDIMDSWIFVSENRDKFFGRIIFPIANYSGNTVAFTGRIIDQGEPKYLNSPASRIFNKSEILYGLHLSKTEIGKKDFVIIVEWQMDTVALHQAGFKNAVGISGTALTKEHISYIKRLTKRIYLCLDGDQAGINATFSSLENLLNEEVEVKIIRLENGKDPDEYIKSGGDFEKAIHEASSVVEFFIALGEKKYDIRSAIGKTAILRDVLKYVRRMESRIEIDMSIKALSKYLELNESTVYAELKNVKSERKIEESPKKVGLNLGETITGYLIAYDFYDLFSAEIPYTTESFDTIPSANLVRNAFKVRSGEIHDVEEDTWKALALYIEEQNGNVQRDAAIPHFRELIKKVQKVLFEANMKKLEEIHDPSSPSYLEAYSRLLSEKKKLGII